METNAYSKWTNYSYFITQPYVILRYIKLLLVPVGLCIDHFIEPAKTILALRVLAPILIIISIFILLYKAWKNKTEENKIILFSTLWFFITLSPTSSFIPIADAMAERRVYLPGVGFYLIIMIIYFKLFKIDIEGRLTLHSKRLLMLIIMSYIMILGYGTIKRNELYQRPILLWQDATSLYPKSARAHNNYGSFISRF